MRPSHIGLLALSLTGCSNGDPSVASAPRVATTIDREVTADAAPPPAPARPCGTSFPPDELEARATAPADAIAVQLDHEPTFGFRPPFARVPAFTLYRDGSVFFPSPGEGAGDTLLTTRVDAATVERIVGRVLALGFERLTSHVEECSCPVGPKQVMICTSDADYTFLRVRLRTGELRTTVVYASNWNEPVTARAIIGYLEGYRPSATPYVPTKATAIVVPSDQREGCVLVDGTLGGVLTLATSSQARGALAVEGAELRALLAKVGASGGGASLCTATSVWRTNVVPWLPGADPSPVLAKWRTR